MKEALWFISDTNTYRVLLQVPLPYFQTDLMCLVERAFRDGILNKREKSFLLPSLCNTMYNFITFPKFI